jgi:hypothetical protein
MSWGEFATNMFETTAPAPDVGGTYVSPEMKISGVTASRSKAMNSLAVEFLLCTNPKMSRT